LKRAMQRGPNNHVAREEAPGRWIDPDLEPMYELRPRDYERIINRMANLVIRTILCLREMSREDAVGMLGRSAVKILANYDDDVAEHIQFATTDDT
jgi:hypothetical protein